MDFKSALTGMILAALGFSLFSFGDLFMKYGTQSFTAVQAAFWISLSMMFGFVSMSHELGGLRRTFKTTKLRLHLLRGGLGVIVFLMMINGFQKLGLAMSYTLIFAGPFIATILSVIILKDKIGIHRWLSIGAGFLGILIVLRPGVMPIDLAAMGILLAAFCFAGGSIIARKIGSDEPILSFAFYNGMISLAVLTILMVIQNGFATLPTLPQLSIFIAVAFFHIGGTFAVTRAFSSSETALVAPFHYIQLLWGMAFGYIFFEMAVDRWTTIGGGIIVLSGIYMIYREKVKHTELNRGVTTHGAVD